MGTRAAAFTAKIHNLQHYNVRIQTGILPLPSGDDVANTLKYFSQTLLSVLKDVPSISMEMLRCAEKDYARTSLFPSLDYKGLFNALVELVDAVPLLQHGSHVLGQTILHTLVCLVPFLEHEYLDTLPYIVASSMTLFPCSLHKDIIDVLCKRLLPFTLRFGNDAEAQNYANMSTASILLMVFQYTDCPAYHCQVLECLMSLKKDVVKELLCVIAHGTAKARGHAAELLFQYLPSLNPALLDRKGIGWKALPCQRENCQSSAGNEAVKMCFNHSIAIGSAEQPPPLYICEACAEDIIKVFGPQHMIDVLLPMGKVSFTCENPECKAEDKSAVATCFSYECASLNSRRPIRYCAECVVFYHDGEKGVDHILHTTIPSPWDMDLETQSYVTEAVISLLHEAEPQNEKNNSETNVSQEDTEESTEVNVVEERQLLSRYGIWLLVGLCTPNENTPVESLGRLLSMLFQWFHYTACLPDDQAGNALERLKAEYIHGWLMLVVKSHFEVFVSCLLPHPADYAKVGGHWEAWPSYTNQIKEGFKRLLCLVPYDIITLEVWEYIMPYWMESFRHEMMEVEFSELKILLSKVLDPDLSPLGFNTKQMYGFLSKRFESCSLQIQEQALSWLQILTMLEVPVPLELLYEMLSKGIESTKKEGTDSTGLQLIPPAIEIQRVMFNYKNASTSTSQVENNQMNESSNQSVAELNMSCFILMLDILLKQLELQDISPHKGLGQEDAQNIMLLMRDMLKVPFFNNHTCSEPREYTQCTFCEICAIWFQLCLLLIEYFSPVMEVTMADIVTTITVMHTIQDDAFLSPEPIEVLKDLKPQTETQELAPKEEYFFQQHEVHKTVKNEAEETQSSNISPILTATVQEFGTPLDIAALIPAEDIVSAVANEVTLTEDDVAVAKCTVASPILVDENNEAIPQPLEDPSFWDTSEGKFKFTLEDLPPQLQLLYALIKTLPSFEDADILYHILSCLKVMCLHSEILNKASHSHRGFVIWCQENLLINNFWKLLQSEFSHIAQLTTYLLLHCITLPCGSDIFWKTLEHDFHSETWRLRYAAVEKVTMIAHFLEPATVKNSPLLQSALANAFSYLVHCLDDIMPNVSQKALLNLETIKTSSLKLLLWCLEVQFDCNMIDRPMILQTVSQMYNHLSHRRCLTWDFFLTRFDTLFLEAQVVLEKCGEISYIRDLKNTNTNSEMFQKKLKRANEALSLKGSMRSLTASFGGKWPYTRTMSAPSSITTRQDKTDKDKYYERQSSAPVLKRKSSRLIGSTVSSLGPAQHFPNSFFTDGHLKETIQEETHFLNVLHRAMDMEEHDRETLHLLIFLLMQFLSSPDPSQRSEDKVSRSQHIVLRHLNLLLGYSQTQNEGKFLIPPQKVRASAVFDAFLMSMPKVLDYNFAMGNFLLHTCLALLACCPAPQKYPNEHCPPTYTLWLLEPYCRHSWLLSVLVVMYKYHYDVHPHSKYIHWLVQIVLNTLRAQWHKCKLSHEPLLSPLPSRSRDFSTPSAEVENIHDKEKEMLFEGSSLHEEIIKPYFGSGLKIKGLGSRFSASADKGDELILEQLQKNKDKGERHVWKSWKASERSCSSEGEDAEPELEAIPESPKSESSLHEPFTSEFAVPLQSLVQSCINLGKEHVSEDGQVPEDPWAKVSNEASDLPNGKTCNANLKQSNFICELNSRDLSENKPDESDVSGKCSTVREKMLNSGPNQCSENTEKEEINVNALVNSNSRPPEQSNNLSSELLSFKESTAVEKEWKNDNLDSEVAMTCSNDQKDEAQKNKLLTLSLPKTDTGSKAIHSKYSHSKLFQSRKKEQPKPSTRKAEMTGNEMLNVPLFRPPLERLLPIGIPEKSRRYEPHHCTPPSQQQHFDSHPYSLQATNFPISNRELFEDKGVQAGGGGLPFDLPAPERLLPIGPPPPSRKEWYTAPGFKMSFSESTEDSKILPTTETLEETVPKPPSENVSPVDIKISNTCESPAVVEPRSPLSKLHRQASLSESKELDDAPAEERNANRDSLSPQNTLSKLGKMFFSLDIGSLQHEQNNLDAGEDALGLDVFNSCNNVCEKGENNRKKESNEAGEKKLEMENFQNGGNVADLLHNEKSESLVLIEDLDSSPKLTEKTPDEEIKCKLPFRQRKQRKHGLSSLEPQRSFDYQMRMRRTEMGSFPGASLTSKRSSTSPGSRWIEDIVSERCTECGVILEEYSDEELGLCVVILATFVHREPVMAAPFLPRMLKVVARIASTTSYPWQSESNVHLPGGSVSVARQFLRCMFHQLTPNGIFAQIFQLHTFDTDFFKTMAAALADFTEINQVSPLLQVFGNLNDKKHLHHETVFLILDNVATYLDCLPLESNLPPWCSFLQQLDLFLRKFLLSLPSAPCQLNSVLHIILAALKMPVINSAKSLLDPFSKILSHAIQHSVLDYQQLVDLCHYCYRNVVKERDKLILTRTAVFELVQALKFKSSIPDQNLLILVQFVLEDAGGSIGPNIIVEGFPVNSEGSMYNTSSCECMRQYLNDALEFVADVHTLNKIKNILYGSSTHLNEETLGGQLKVGIAQYLAIEISKGNGRDNRAIGRYLPWLYHPPTALQQGPKEFIDCVSHIRLLSWLLVGALTHSSLMQHTGNSTCQPIPIEANGHIAEHIQVILAGFAEQSKVSVLHMSSLFHAFILCQLWTMYCEHMVSQNPPGSEQSQICSLTLTDFWAKVTPGILQLVCHSKILAEMVSLHFLSLMEALMECNSTVLARLLPMWTPVLYGTQGQVSGNLHVRLRACVNFHPPFHTREDASSMSSTFLRWLQRLQFKMGQVELQSSAATQFYSL